MKIKGWKKLGDKWAKSPTGKKVRTPEHIIYQTYGPKPAEISIKRMYIPKTKIPMYWNVKIWKQGKLRPFLDKPFGTKKESLTFAIKWMRIHPEGK